MISIRIDKAATEKLKESVVKQANRKYRTWIYRIFEDALWHSFQYSGDYVSNWHIVVGGSSEAPSYQEWPDKYYVATAQQMAPRQMGDLEAITFARDRATRKPFTYKDKVYLFNPSPLEATGLTVTGPAGDTKPLRPENVLPGGVTLRSYLRIKYGGVS